MDNLFVFVLVFDYFQVPNKFQPRVLSYGIYGKARPARYCSPRQPRIFYYVNQTASYDEAISNQYPPDSRATAATRQRHMRGVLIWAPDSAEIW